MFMYFVATHDYADTPMISHMDYLLLCMFMLIFSQSSDGANRFEEDLRTKTCLLKGK